MKRLILILALMLLPKLAEAATYYVDQGCGNVATYNPVTRVCTGGTATSRTTIQAAVNLATTPGDIVDIRTGTYVESVQFWGKIGSSGSPINYRGHTGETVTIRPTSGAGIDVASGSTWLSFNHLKVDGSNLTGGQTNITVNNSTDLVFDDIESFDNSKNTPSTNPGAGAYVNGTRVTFSACFMHHNGAYSSAYKFDGNQAPYGFYWPGSNGTIDGCRVEDNGAFGIQAYPTPSGMTIKNSFWARNGNNFYAADGSGSRTSTAILSYSDNSKIHNNVIYEAPLQNGITVAGANSAVFNNTVYNTGQGGIEFFNGIAVTIKNNILVNTVAAKLVDSGGTPTYSNNLCFGTGANTSCNITGSDPLFTSAATGDFRLQTGSPAIDAGVIIITTGISVPACSGGNTTACYNGPLPDLGGLESGIATVAGGPPTLTPSASTVIASAQMTLNVDDDDVNERVEDPGDWVGMFVPGQPASVSVDWFYMNASKTAPAVAISDAVIPFTAPSTVGAYEFRFYRNNGTTEADRLTTAAFTVVAPGIVMKFNISSMKIGPSVTWKVGTP